MTYREVYESGRSQLMNAGITEYEIDARLLLEHVCDTDRNTLLAHPEREVMQEEEAEYSRLLSLRANHVPLQHITGVQDFMGMTFEVSDKVLIPRQDTEILVEEALIYIDDGMRVLDMCTGSGCILLSIMNYKNDIDGVGCDVSKAALEVARLNAERLNINAQFLCGDMFEALEGNAKTGKPKTGKPKTGKPVNKERFDVIVSNPPYICSDVIPTLMSEVKDHDPMAALDGGADGLDFYRRIADKAPEYLNNYGRLFLEIGYDQGESVPKILENAGFSDIFVKNDYSGQPRVVVAKYIKGD